MREELKASNLEARQSLVWKGGKRVLFVKSISLRGCASEVCVRRAFISIITVPFAVAPVFLGLFNPMI